MSPTHQAEGEKSRKNKVFQLNPAQKSAAEAPVSPLLIVAGAGTGKTRTLTSRMVYLIDGGTPPEKICAITFTNKAAQEMRNRISREEPFIGTFHSLGARILRGECRRLGRTPNFVIFDDHDSFDLIKKIVKKSLVNDKNKKNTPAFFARQISKIKNIDSALDGLKEPPERAALIRDVFHEYEAALARNNAFDFDDLIEKPVALFGQHPEVLEKYRAKFDALLVDEYQDINPKQYEFVKLLAGGHNNLSVVGDDEQTIYSWRYADIRTFLDFDKDWPGAKIHFLEENYRSTATIIRAAAAVAENNRYRTPKKL
jgi:DNA helicase-2/ATP-dependent DNA helicase PcrA